MSPFEFFRRSLLPPTVMLAACWQLFFSAALAASPLEEYFAGLQTLQGEFRQRSLSFADQPPMRGVFQLQRPDRFRWQYRSPYEQTIITDGQRLWLYDADLAQVSIKPMSAAMKTSGPAALLTSRRPLADLFSITALATPADDRDWYELVPTEKADEPREFEKLQIALSAQGLAVMVIFDMLGNATEITFSHLRRNLPIASDLFTFVPPPGSDVIDETGLQ